MKKLVLIIVLTVLGVNLAIAQTDNGKEAHPDFSGVWTFQSVTTNPKSASQRNRDNRIQIIHTDPQLILTVLERSDGQDAGGGNTTFYTDERGDKNKLESKTKWDGRKIVTKYPNDMQVILELLPDNKLSETVTIKTTIKINMFGREETQTTKTVTKTIYVKET